MIDIAGFPTSSLARWYGKVSDRQCRGWEVEAAHAETIADGRVQPMPIDMRNNLDELFASLSRSKFRSRFRLNAQDADYLRRVGFDITEQHAIKFIESRLAPAQPQNDGRQTPFRGHPVFVAQHATATCCRSCLRKWHRIEKDTPLTDEQVRYVVHVIHRWLEDALLEARDAKPDNGPAQLSLFAD